jgi:hypothetical protein
MYRFSYNDISQGLPLKVLFEHTCEDIFEADAEFKKATGLDAMKDPKISRGVFLAS